MVYDDDQFVFIMLMFIQENFEINFTTCEH